MSDIQFRQALRSFAQGDREPTTTSPLIRTIPEMFPETQAIVGQLSNNPVLLATVLVNYQQYHDVAQGHVEEITRRFPELKLVQPLRNIFSSELDVFVSKTVWLLEERGGSVSNRTLILYTADYQIEDEDIFSISASRSDKMLLESSTSILDVLGEVIHA